VEADQFIRRALKSLGADLSSGSLKYISHAKGSQLFKWDSGSVRWFIKYYFDSGGDLQSRAEGDGLEKLMQVGGLNAPALIGQLEENGKGLLVMDFVEISQSGRSRSMETFGRQLAGMHKNAKAGYFGHEMDNYIGTLDQFNGKMGEWAEFYFYRRLLPQLEMAASGGLLSEELTQKPEQWIHIIHEIYPRERPSLLHGDLWSGNLIADASGTPFVIDPAVYFGHREMDLAMTHLFGGFSSEFYRAYEEEYPLSPGFESRMELSQLYYLLVHVNLFGSSYVPATKGIIQKYFEG